MKRPHKERAFVAMNISGRKPYFAIAAFGWSARMARDDLLSGLTSTWSEMKKSGWRIAKVNVTEIPRKTKVKEKA